MVDGLPVRFESAEAAIRNGITAIHQETVLFDELSVAENIFLGHAPRNRLGLVNWAAMNARAAALLTSIDAPISPYTRLKDLSIAHRHLVAIARALSVEARVVIMDEPTAALSYKEIEDLFRIIERLKNQGKAILFISHKFEEVYEIAERFAVFRDGRSIGSGLLAETGQDEIVRMMVGRSVEHVFPKVDVAIGSTVLKVSGYSHPTEFDNISFELRRGEILGLYGLVGAGRSELCQALFGITHASAGNVTLDGRPIVIRSPVDAICCRHRLCARGTWHAMALVLPMPIFQNIYLPSSARRRVRGFLRQAEEFALARHYAEQARPSRRGAFSPRRHVVGRQPAEGRHRQSGSPRGRRSSFWTSRPRASTSAPRRRCTPS